MLSISAVHVRHSVKAARLKDIYFIKISNDFVEQPEALQSFLVDVRFGVKLFKVRNGGEHDAHQVIGLVIQVLRDKTVGDKADISFKTTQNDEMQAR